LRTEFLAIIKRVLNHCLKLTGERSVRVQSLGLSAAAIVALKVVTSLERVLVRVMPTCKRRSLRYEGASWHSKDLLWG
jgi:hypothetical protein